MKKRMFKKVMSAVLSVAMLVSVMMVPANAVVPGEDAYSGESTIVRYNYDTGIEEPIHVSSENLYPGTSTYSFLSKAELARIESGIETQAIIDDGDPIKDGREIVYPTVAPYSGVVLIITLFDYNGDKVADDFIPGTGFMVAENVLLTARHCVYSSDDDIMEVRVYQGVSVSHSYDGIDVMSLLDCLEIYNYDTFVNSVYDTRYSNSGDDLTKYGYDWCIGILRTGFECYYFNCTVANIALEGSTVTITGYPFINKEEGVIECFFMRSASGEVVSFCENSENKLFDHKVDTISGQSGSPVYKNGTQGLTCYGIHVAGNSTVNTARSITPDVYNLLVDTIR